MEVLINIVGSVALLLWGIRMVRTAVTRSFGAELRGLLAQTLSRRLSAFAAGLGVTALLQSSNATALLVVSFANTGAIAPPVALAILLGADVGTTLVVQVFTQRIEWLSPLFVTVGVITFLAAGKSKSRNIGRGILGLGLITLALQGISVSAKPLASSDVVQVILQSGLSEPLLLVLVVAALTVLIHSSVATILLVGTLAAVNAIGLVEAIIVVLGANLGGALIPVMTTWMQPTAARLPAVANALVRGVGVLVVLPFADAVANASTSLDLAPQLGVAHFHTVFNLALALIALPLVHPIISVTQLLFRASPPATNQPFNRSNLQDDVFDTPAVALACATRETLSIGDTVEEMLERSFEVFRDDDSDRQKFVEAMDDDVDRMHDAIKIYVARLLREELEQDEGERAIEILSFATNLEHIGDIIDKNLMELAGKKRRAKAVFSEEGLSELEGFHDAVRSNLRKAIHVFMSGDLDLARELIAEKTIIRERERHSIERHFERLTSGTASSIDTSSLHLDILRDLKRINSHLTSAAYPILERAGELAESRLRTTHQHGALVARDTHEEPPVFDDRAGRKAGQ